MKSLCSLEVTSPPRNILKILSAIATLKSEMKVIENALNHNFISALVIVLVIEAHLLFYLNYV